LDHGQATIPVSGKQFVDDFAVVPSVWRPATVADCLKVSANLGQLLVKYVLTRHQVKGVWYRGDQVLTHLRFVLISAS
jgi:N-acetyl-beta-hexosaminidase